MTSVSLIEEVSRLVSDITGIQLGKKQFSMVESRLTRRMIQLGITQPEDYLRYMSSHREAEVTALVSLLTTHHTNFFREFSHFEYLEKTGLPHLIEGLRKRGEKTLRIWSAACSRGHEVYSLSMFLSVHLKRLAPEMKFEIFGSDVDPKSVEIAANGVYRWDDIKSIPSLYLAEHWARGTGEIASYVKAKASIKASCSWGTVNLLNFSQAMAGKKFDIIFCRNVFIYFTAEQVKAITSNLLKFMNPEGFLFIGISESLNGSNLPLTYLAPSVYTHQRPEPMKMVSPAVTAPILPQPKAVALPPKPSPEKPVRVFCIDDSATILSLMKKILTPEMGFEVIGTAVNGAEATEKLKQLHPDVVTLDIHMPVQNGIEYLEKNLRAGHPPVVMVTSVSREDATLGLKSLALGASDYVEKPSLADLAKRADEIRTKLRCAAIAGSSRTGGVFEIEKAFGKTFSIRAPESKLRLIVGGLGDREKFVQVLRGFSTNQPPCVIFVQGSDVLIPGIAAAIEAGTGTRPLMLDTASQVLARGQVYLANAELFESFRKIRHEHKPSLMVFGDVSGDIVDGLLGWRGSHLITEDLSVIVSSVHRQLLESAAKVVPATSFAYHSDEFLSQQEVIGGK